MRKLLQNKMAVSCLAAVAVLSVTASFVKLPRFGPLATAAREAMTETAAPAPESKPRVHGTVFARLLNKPWRELAAPDPHARDPFAFPPTSVTKPAPAPRPDDLPKAAAFVLQAVSIDGDRAFAVINKMVVAEGESVDGYRVEQIRPDRVQLAGRAGKIELALSRNRPSAREKSSTANVPRADLPAGTAGTTSGQPKP